MALGTGLGAGGEVLADALAIEPASEAENDFPGRIREFGNDNCGAWDM